MFELNSKKVELGKNNNLIKKEINLDKDLDCFMVISCEDEKFGELFLNKILDSIIDKITIKNYYNDFSVALQNVNHFINTWKNSNDAKLGLDVVIGILYKNTFTFSNIGKSSCYLLKRDREIVEVTKSSDNKKEFGFISNGELNDSEIIILSTKRLLNYLSESDFIDGLNSDDGLKGFNKNIKNILLKEDLEKDILITSFRYNKFSKEEIKNTNKKLEFVKDKFLSIADTNFAKRFYAYFLKIEDIIRSQSKLVKNIIILFGILICFFLLFTSISNIVSVSNQTEDDTINVQKIVDARDYIKQASRSTNNIDIFEENIKKAEEIIDELKQKNVGLKDIEKLNDDLIIIKKQFNKIETFDDSDEKLIYKDEGNKLNIQTVKGKKYIIKEKSILGPIIATQTPSEITFDKLGADEVFIKSVSIGFDIFLLTNKSKIVNFSTNNSYFKFYDVTGQDKWQESRSIESFGQNIYILGKNNQVYKHSKKSDSFSAGDPYLKEEDVESLGDIIDISIDGGIYLLKDDLTIVKFFKSPKYRMESLMLNNLPSDYNKEEGNNELSLKSGSKLSYVYMLLNNRILVFKPNTTRIADTKSLTFIGQIEGNRYEILDFFVENDSEITVLNENGVYKMSFDINEDKIMMK